jgi:fibro-slime domain-containing protein
MFRRPRSLFGWFVLLTVAGGACGQSKNSDHDDDVGEAGASGGSSGKGGASGGRGGSGGSTAGGSKATGGSNATGGIDVPGGAPSEAGGTDASGGTGASGGTESAGSDASGGVTSGGSGGTAGDTGSTGGTDGEAGGGATGSADCGNAYRDATDECDDGNHVNGDGCHSDCTVEAGFVCYSALCDADTGACSLPIPAVFRDFSSGVGTHPDFQPGFASEGAVQGLVERLLDPEGKPVLSNLATASNSFIHSKAGFADWYRDGEHSGGPIAQQIILWDDGTGRYVNRWGKDGEQWPADASSLDYGAITYGGPGGTGCEACVPIPTGACYDPCIPWSRSQQACCVEIAASMGVDDTPLFFPIDQGPALLTEPRSEGKIAAQYGWIGYPWETDVADVLDITTPIETAHAPFPSTTHNFSFTSEVKAWVRYQSDQPLLIELGGDDDVWLFVNGRLAIDLGAWHTSLEGSVAIAGGTVTSTAELSEDGDIVIQSGTAESFGLEDGLVFPIAVFHAERQKETSAFKLAIGGADLKRSVCVPEE